MRTTLTLDDDVAAQLRRLVRQTGRPFKQVVNDTLRAGLLPTGAPPPDAAELVPTFRLQQRPGMDMVRARHLAAELEDEETVREMERRK